MRSPLGTLLGEENVPELNKVVGMLSEGAGTWLEAGCPRRPGAWNLSHWGGPGVPGTCLSRRLLPVGGIQPPPH